MNDELINRIDFAIRNESTQDYIELLADCRAALSRKYVPMKDDELVMVLRRHGQDSMHGLRALQKEFIRRAAPEVSNEPK